MLDAFKAGASDLVVETWITKGDCGATEKKVVKQVETTTQRPEATEDEVVTLIKRAKTDGLQPHILELSCAEYRAIEPKDGEVDYEKLLGVITEKLRRAIIFALAMRRAGRRAPCWSTAARCTTISIPRPRSPPTASAGDRSRGASPLPRGRSLRARVHRGRSRNHLAAVVSALPRRRAPGPADPGRARATLATSSSLRARRRRLRRRLRRRTGERSEPERRQIFFVALAVELPVGEPLRAGQPPRFAVAGAPAEDAVGRRRLDGPGGDRSPARLESA